ncbi:ATP-binding cassette domain-containing protein [Aquamicrobium sp. LC103]|uniref:iron ABC transporter ATP-binding protein n=1 Tax=Aquamicrobium sp. LC103 TaxID=1120658 RepID=UPI00063EA6B7|nr:ATP-binding cassette domain-containing protein [Aquamicrobium sp. LC103]TKT69701.1 ATP-binding cassette domain-containing protein [Aquamicrobium sp. LC103]
MIELDKITKSYGETVVVDGVCISLQKAGVTAIIGPNGAGKSTLLSIVGRILGADAGTVHIDGMDVARTPGDALARRLSLLRQENHMSARLTVRDLVTFGRYPHSKGRYTADDAAHVERAIGFLGLEPLADRFLDELSGGQRQRAFIAMVLCQDTDYVLFDEPLNNLDIKHGVAIMRLIQRAARELGKTVIVVLHDINIAAAYCDRILVMKDGRIVEHGEPAEIMKDELLSAIYEAPITVHRIEDRLVAIY